MNLIVLKIRDEPNTLLYKYAGYAVYRKSGLENVKLLRKILKMQNI